MLLPVSVMRLVHTHPMCLSMHCICVYQTSGRCACSSGLARQAARGLSTATASNASNAGTPSSKDTYVSPHDWGAIERDYGKAKDAASVGQAAEIQTIEAKKRSLEEVGSRYSRRLRAGACGRIFVVVRGKRRQRQGRSVMPQFCAPFILKPPPVPW